MRAIHRVVLLTFPLFVSGGIGAAPSARVIAARAVAAQPVGEVRGLWVLRTSLVSPQAIAEVVRAAAAGGFNTLLVQVRGRGEAFYDSRLEPRAADLDGAPGGFDPLALTVSLAHQAGLRVHAWINVNLVASAVRLPRSRDHVVWRHPDWLMVPRELAAGLRPVSPASPAYVGNLARWTRDRNDQVEGLFLSPLTPASRAYTTSVVAEIASRYAVDGIHLDYLRYPLDTFDYSPAALAAFRATRAPLMTAAQRARIDAVARTSPTIWADQFPVQWTAFRLDQLTRLVAGIRTAIKRVRPDIVLSAAVLPDPDRARTEKRQDWAAWAQNGLLDVVCPMAYAEDLTPFEAEVHAARAASGVTPVWVGIGAYRLPVSATAEHLAAARRAGVAGLLIFSYDSLTAPDAPEADYLDALRPRLLEQPAGSGAGR